MRRLLVSFLIFIHAVVASAANYDNIIVRHYSEVEGFLNNIVNSVIKPKTDSCGLVLCTVFAATTAAIFRPSMAILRPIPTFLQER